MNLKLKTGFILVIVWCLILTFNREVCLAESPQINTALTSKQKTAIISMIEEIFNKYYPLPDTAKSMLQFIHQKQNKGEYNQNDGLIEFTSQLTKDMRSVSKDWHIKVWPYEKISEDLLAETKLGTPENNFGFQNVEILPGNIGYINFTSFINPRTGGAAAIAAMSFVSNCDALIIDLRNNGGGDISMAGFLSTYFFEKKTHLNDVYIRKDDKTTQVWTQEWVPGPRLIDVPIYILLSSFSYSAAEAFSYQLQQLGRAVIVGEKTRGGAHAVKYMSFKELSFNLKIPYTRDINPYSKTNFANGIKPDVMVSSDKALRVANIRAARKLLETESNKDTRYKLKWVISGNQADLNPVILEADAQIEYTGIYGNNRILLECGRLYHKWKDNTLHELVPMGNDLFKYREPGEAHYRIQFSRDNDGIISEFYEHDSDGDRYPAKKKVGN